MTIRELPQDEETAWIATKARELARSGDFEDYAEIEIRLRDASRFVLEVLDNESLRRELNLLCREAVAAKS